MSVQSSTIGAAPLDNGRRSVRVTGVPSPRCCHTGGNPPSAITEGNNTTPVATTTYLAEVTIPFPTVINNIVPLNGTVASGNQCAALYTSNGTLLATTPSTSVSGTQAFQALGITTFYANNNGTTVTGSGPARVEAGTYYVALQVDNTTVRTRTHILGAFGTGTITSGTYGTFPATITPPVTFTTNVGPIASLS